MLGVHTEISTKLNMLKQIALKAKIICDIYDKKIRYLFSHSPRVGR